MGFILRSAFWLSLVFLFVPFHGGHEEAHVDPVGPLQAAVAARDAIRDVTALCERQPGVCDTARSAAETMAARAGEGMSLARQAIESPSSRAPEAPSTLPGT